MNKNELTLALVQADLKWEDQKANLQHFEEMLGQLDQTIDLLILPEMFTTGFSMNAESLAEPEPGPSLLWMQQQAASLDAAVTGSLIIREGKTFHNRLYMVYPDGSYGHYDKRHTFTLANEHLTYERGTSRTTMEWRGWTIFPLICYDLRFPVWARNDQDYDLLIYVANWPEKRVAAWDALLKARAIENMAYCAGVNRVGVDGNGFPYVGHSAVYDMLGETMLDFPEKQEGVACVTLYKDRMLSTRSHLQFLQDRDDFNLEV
jgi:predicted amidohydrolase